MQGPGSSAMKALIVLQDLSYFSCEGSRPYILQNVSFHISQGEAVAIIGPNGAGKSTLAQIMAGLIKPHAGRVLKKAGLGVIGLVFQFPEQQLFGETVGEDVSFGPVNIGLSTEDALRYAKDALAQVGLPASIMGRSPYTLSGGEQRRVAIAGVLAMHPEVVIFDEPTAGLDPAGRALMLELIRDLQRKEGKTVIVISHEMDEVASWAQRVIVLHQGRVVADGPARMVLTDLTLLKGAGLEPPWPSAVAAALRERGWPLSPHCLTVDELADEIRVLVTGKGGTE